MSKKSAMPAPAPAGQKKQIRGPLSPMSPEVTLYTTIIDGKFAATSQLPPRPRSASILVTDDAQLVPNLSHSELILVGETPPRQAVTHAYWKALALATQDRTITIAGSPSLIEASLDEAFRIVAECPDNTVLPFPIAEWRANRAKGSETITLTRD